MVTDINRIPEAKAAIRTGLQRGLESSVNQMDDRIQWSFANGRDPLGNEWAPLSPETIRRKGHGQILVESGKMRDSFETNVNKRKLEATISSGDPKLPYHEYGTIYMPRRPIMRPAALWAEQKVIGDTFTAEIGGQLDRIRL